MTSAELLETLEANRENLAVLLDALDADYELEENPAKQAAMGALFNPDSEAAKSRLKDADDMTDEEVVAFLFETNAEALAAAAEAAAESSSTATRDVRTPGVGKESELDDLGTRLS